MSQDHPANLLRSGSEAFLRVLFGVFLALVAIALTMLSTPVPFAAVTVVMALFAAREWHRLVRSPLQRQARNNLPRHPEQLWVSCQLGQHSRARQLFKPQRCTYRL